MIGLRPPATGTEIYLSAIHEVLCDIRAALVGGGGEPAPETADPTLPAPAASTKRSRARGSRTPS